MITLHNSRTRKKEVFEPLAPDNIRMYVCGPTVYDRAHIGNARAVVVFDTLYRLLIQAYGKNHVHYVRNITDVDDKINAAAKERNIPISELTTATTTMFHDDMAALGCLSPDIEPRATQHIPEMIAMVERLIAANHAYAAKGHVLFDVHSYADYGKLSNRSQEEMLAGARVEVAPYKKNPGDFVLWKPSAADEPGWDSPWGRGRPGWHLECSAMSTKYLGVTFDIHGGGADLTFPHHENEIAQSCCANPHSQFSRYWVHNGFLSVNGDKMSKSLGNFITVHDLLSKGIKGEVIRYALMATHYRKPLDWSDKAAADAQKALDGFYTALAGTTHDDKPAGTHLPKEFIEALQDDMNTPKALAMLHQLASQTHKAKDQERISLAYTLKAAGNLLGLLEQNPSQWFIGKEPEADEADDIVALITQRNDARKSKNWTESDRIRDALVARGIVLIDRPDGTTEWRRK